MFIFWLFNLSCFFASVTSHICMLPVFEASGAKNKPFHYHELTDISFFIIIRFWRIFYLVNTMSKWYANIRNKAPAIIFVLD